ncbi:sigma-70 family RNA polymerase sigma factor [Cytobacillus spongiae]|uniref:sigma-70 family RNA polymerase sigma factor n=1 Tax=Cytobacillus spongiae TaxID=2901381 RepID=UPI001F397AF8|nr:sigma-70 family RNA polymerase sigma factor [Cytobacillus spongiae]UII57657.1 sigma-70 family RNA polymerase sigma factor [Cytobacillus spongiae]
MESFEEVKDKYERLIWKIIQTLHIYKNKEEFYQIGLIALWQAHVRYNAEKGSFYIYAYSFIRGKIQTQMSRQNQFDERNIFPTEEYLEQIEGDNNQHFLEEHYILSLCEHLTANQKKWVLYTALHDLSIFDIAKKEHVSPSAVKAWRKGAKERLRGHLVQN